MNNTATSVCVDRTKCTLSKKDESVLLTIEKGSKIISNTRHLKHLGTLSRKENAIEYTTQKRLVLLVANPEQPTNQCIVFQKLTFKKTPLSATEKRKSVKMCMDLNIDGWYVTKRHPNGEALVLINPVHCLS